MDGFVTGVAQRGPIQKADTWTHVVARVITPLAFSSAA